MAGSLTPVMYWAVRTTVSSALQSEAKQLPYQAVMQPVGTLSKVQLYNFLRIWRRMLNLFSLLRGNRHCYALFMTVLVCLDRDSLLVLWTPRNMKISNCSTTTPSMRMGDVYGRPFPVVHNHLLCLDHFEGEFVILAPHCQVFDLPIGSSFSVIRPTTLVASENLMMGLESCLAMQSGVNREYRSGLSTHPLGAPVLRISMADVLLPTLTTWGRPGRKSRIQEQREVFRPRVLSLVLSFEGTMVLNAELYSMNSIFVQV